MTMRRTTILAALTALAALAAPAVATADPLPSGYGVVDGCGGRIAGVSTASDLPRVDVQVSDVTALAEPDDGRNVRIDVLVLLDGVTETRAAQIFADVAAPYAEIGVTVAPTYQATSPFVATDAIEIIEEARSRFAGEVVPAAYDMVEVLTSKNITGVGGAVSLTGGITAGTALCEGGARDPRYAFEVSEAGDGDDAGHRTAFLRVGAKAAAKVTAHEMGHLFGAEHEYAGCGEGVSTSAPFADAPCTLMFYDANLINLHFGTVNGRLVRGHALRYAAAND